MEAVAIIQLGIAGINLISKSIEAANNGDLATAEKLLAEARSHFANSLDKWNSTDAPD